MKLNCVKLNRAEKLTKREAKWLQAYDDAAAADNPIDQAKAWKVIHNLCIDLGMYKTQYKDIPGIVRVCEFIYKAVKKSKARSKNV